MVFLILAAQFETWTLPLAVIMAVPFALAGAPLAILIRGMPNDIYFQVGLIALIGLTAKNAIQEGMRLRKPRLKPHVCAIARLS